MRNKLVVAVAAMLVGLVAGTAGAENPFTDIDNTGSHRNNIDAIYNAGITLGCAQGPTFYCPGDTVTRQQMASFIARAMGLSSGTTKNLPKANARGDLRSFCAAAAANPESFAQGMCAPIDMYSLNTLETHQASNIVLGVGGLPTYVTRDSELVRCHDVFCGSFTQTDFGSDVLEKPFVTMNASGVPIIGAIINSFPYILVCSSPQCYTAGSTVFDNVSSTTKITVVVGPDNLPVVVYDLGGGVFSKKCLDEFCSSMSARTTINDDGAGSSAATIWKGSPLVVYADRFGNVRCDRCATSVVAQFGGSPSVAVGIDGRPVIAFRDINTNDAVIAPCLDDTCSSFGRTDLSELDDFSDNLRLAIGLDGMPLLSHAMLDDRAPVQALTKCTDAKCTGYAGVAGARNGASRSLVVGPDGVPTVYFFINGFLGLLRPAVT